MTDLAVVGLSAETRALMLYEARKKSVGVAYLLWLFLGAFGGHRFYSNRTPTAVAILVLWIVGWMTIWVGFGLIPLAAVGVWLLVDAFLIPGWITRHNTTLLAQLDQAAKRPQPPYPQPFPATPQGA